MEDNPPEEFIFLTITFRDRPAGCAATTSLRKTAQMSQESEPKAVKVIEDDTYVDDVCTRASTVDDMKKMITSIEKITRPGGFHFKKWIVSGDLNEEVKLLNEKVLGIRRNSREDILVFTPEVNPSPKKRGKRWHQICHLRKLPKWISVNLQEENC
jgi:hypothetical protein